MREIIFLVEEAPDGGYTARALGESIFTEGDDLDSVRANIVDAVRCHYPVEADRPSMVRMHLVKDEILTV